MTVSFISFAFSAEMRVCVDTFVCMHIHFYICVCMHRGHKSAVTCLKFNSTGTQLVSGAKGTHVVLWDLVSERGLVRLVGVDERVVLAIRAEHSTRRQLAGMRRVFLGLRCGR